jgi:hypothetical protein
MIHDSWFVIRNFHLLDWLTIWLSKYSCSRSYPSIRRFLLVGSIASRRGECKSHCWQWICAHWIALIDSCHWMDYSSILRLWWFWLFWLFWWFWLFWCLKWCSIAPLFRSSDVSLFICFFVLCSLFTYLSSLIPQKSTLYMYRVRLSFCSRAHYPHRMPYLKHCASRWRDS